MTSFAGTRALFLLALRRDRIRLPIWIAVFVSLAATSASATAGLYPTLAARVQAAETFNQTKALVALYGRIYDPTSLGALAMLKAAGTGAIFVAVMAIVTVVRHSRADEETGRRELLGATVVGRHAPLTAALLVTAAADLMLALFTALASMAAGLPGDGSIAFGLAWAGVGIAFAAVAAVTAQLTRSARSATGLAVAFLGLVYVLRAVGDTADITGPRWLSWLSPIGWGQQFRPYAGNRWWVLLITAGFAVVVTFCAYALAARRDVGAGLLPDRPGPPIGSATLRSPLALAWRLHRGSLIAWAAGFMLLGFVFGNIASSVGDFVDTPQARALFTKLGGKKALVDAFLAAELGFVGVAAAAYGIQAALRMRTEESGLHAEPLLATATSRIGWAGSHIAMALLGSAALMATAGISAGVAHGAQVGRMSEAGDVIGAALVQVPAAWVLSGIVVASFGLLPRFVAVGWGALVAFVLLGQVGPVLELDQTVLDLSPFTHVPKMPGGELSLTPLVVLTGVVALLIGAGLIGFRRRDILA